MTRRVTLSDFQMRSPSYLNESYKTGSIIKNSPTHIMRKIQHLESGEKRLLKIIPKNRIELCERDLLSEVSVMLKLDHPCICRLCEFFQDYSNFYVITERLLGGDLLYKIASMRKHSEAICATYMQQIFSSLQELEEKRIIHRHIRPNAFIFGNMNNNETLIMVDFRYCKQLADGENAIEMVGSSNYIAPEVLNNNYSTKSDM